jgi:hypothetical protein
MSQFKVNIMPYNYTIKVPDDKKPGATKDEIKTCDVADVMANVMLSPRLQHRGFRFYTVAKTATKIKNAKDEFVILDNTEYAILKESFDNTQGFGPNDTELVNRVYEAQRVE